MKNELTQTVENLVLAGSLFPMLWNPVVFFSEIRMYHVASAQSCCDMLENFLHPKIEKYKGFLVLIEWDYCPYSTPSTLKSSRNASESGGFFARGNLMTTVLACGGTSAPKLSNIVLGAWIN